jgi:hypothetical protein
MFASIPAVTSASETRPGFASGFTLGVVVCATAIMLRSTVAANVSFFFIFLFRGFNSVSNLKYVTVKRKFYSEIFLTKGKINKPTIKDKYMRIDFAHLPSPLSYYMRIYKM